jgi:hypothetical protein
LLLAIRELELLETQDHLPAVCASIAALRLCVDNIQASNPQLTANAPQAVPARAATVVPTGIGGPVDASCGFAPALSVPLPAFAGPIVVLRQMQYHLTHRPTQELVDACLADLNQLQTAHVGDSVVQELIRSVRALIERGQRESLDAIRLESRQPSRRGAEPTEPPLPSLTSLRARLQEELAAARLKRGDRVAE